MDHSPGFLALVSAAKAKVVELTVDEWVAAQGRGEAMVLIDVREDDEWRAGHARGAVHLGRGILERDVEKQYPDKNTPLVLYCGGGFRSALAAESLQKMGYANVRSLAGGWRAWNEHKLPTE
jgi:rhodanese-related sulfurtransferase